ncbi:MAG: 3'(2'),5'-bisphosphate nucleotidase CysQ [Acidobacteria bacterium]|nr:3'(2'),5'-bisphosphate nucleotidase CysQ [Acidobacteriota bacterium]
MTLTNELETAVALARAAGAKILDFYAREIVAEQKIGVDNFYEPVTAADKAASRLVVDGLAAAFPGDGILSEEEEDAVEIRTQRERVWMIDPIDGTLGFIKKDGDFGVQIGLSAGGRAILGVVYLPFHDELYYAAAGEGAFLIEKGGAPQSLQVSAESDFTRMTLAVSRNHLSPKMARVSQDFGFADITHRGSVGLKVGLIAKRSADLYIHLSPRTKFWDSCAPQIILEEAGGTLTDLFGAPIRYDLHDVQNHNGLLASNGAAHDRTVARLRPLLAEFGRLRVRSKGN